MPAAGFVAGALATASLFWSNHGVTIPCHDRPVVADLPGNLLALSVPGRCGITIDRSFYHAYDRLPPRAKFARRRLQLLCVAMAHERGHNIGLGHAPGTIMDPVAEDAPVPHECIEWSVRLVPRRASDSNASH